MKLRKIFIERPIGTDPHLDGLRAMAALIIVLFHCFLFVGGFSETPDVKRELGFLLPMFNGLWSGIDIFFVLSGFLIGRILIRDLSENHFLPYKRFIIRRIFRIIPAYYFLLLITVFIIIPLQLKFSVIFFGASDPSILKARSIGNFLFVSNYLYPGQSANAFSWAWSLCVEEHFYIFAPFFLWALFAIKSSRLRMGILIIVALLPMAGRAGQFFFYQSVRLLDGFYYYSHNHFDEIFIGVLTAYAFIVYPDSLKRFVEFMGRGLWMTAFAFYGIVWIYGGLFNDRFFNVVVQFFLMAFGTALLIINGLFRKDRVTTFFSHRLWFPLARISYGLYLVHPLILYIWLDTYIRYQGSIVMIWPVFILFLGTVLSVSAMLAGLLFYWVEGPMLSLGRRLTHN